MRVLQFAKRSVVTVALVSLALAGCSGESTPDAPFNPAGTSADLDAMNSTFASPAFASFSTFSLMFDGALGGSPIISASVAALDVRGKDAPAIRAAAVRSAARLAATLKRGTGSGFSASVAAVPAEVAGKTFVYDPNTISYVASDLAGAPANGVRFVLYAVDPVTYTPVEPLNATGHVDLIDLSDGSTQAARVLVVSGSTTYVDYTASATTGTSSSRLTVIGMVTDGINQAKINLQSTFSFTTGLTLTYSVDLPQRDVSIDLTIGSADVSQQDSPITVSLSMRGPNGTIGMSGQFTDTSGSLNITINGSAFARVTTSGTSVTYTRYDGTPLSDEELQVLVRVFALQEEAFISFDQMLAPVGAFFDEPV
ncbi:MAG TPA: hypothetical protein VE420_06310 [Gemmatimonadales bacterium]|nr:hypothetical protein [Gemmatimonadales bacterium]